MKRFLEYRENSYFNDTDFFMVYDEACDKLTLTKAELYNGMWYATTGLQFKLISVKTYNCNLLLGKSITYIGTELKGMITQFLPNRLGIFWESGKNIQTHGMPYYWNYINNLTLI